MVAMFQKMENNPIDELRKRILPVLLFCQSNKGDLTQYSSWSDKEDADKKLFYAYYSGLFCRILCVIESEVVARRFISKCDKLLNKYNWYDIQSNDLELFKAVGTYECEVADALEFIDGIDNVVWNDTNLLPRNAYCIKTEHSSWTFADVRGSV